MDDIRSEGSGPVRRGQPAPHPASAAVAPPRWSDVGRALVVRLDNLGDVVLTTPALRALRTALPAGAGLDLLTSPGGLAVAPLLPWVDDAWALRAVWQDAGGALPLDPGRELALVDDLRARRYDAVVVLTSFSQSPWPMAYAAYLAGIGTRVGQSAEFGGSLLTHWVTRAADDTSAHQVDRSLRLLAAVGVAPAGRRLELAVPDRAREQAAALLDGADVLVAPGASCPSRRYDPVRLREAVAGLQRAGRRCAVVGTDRERALVEAVAAGTGALALAGGLDVPALAAAVDAVDLVVTNNSGCLHLADALGTPQVVLFAGTERVSQYGPRTSSAAVLRRDTGCTPCRAFTCPYAMECLDVPAAEVVEAALGLPARRRAA